MNKSKTFNKNEGYCLYYIYKGSIVIDDNEFYPSKYLGCMNRKELEDYIGSLSRVYKRKYYVGKFKSKTTYFLLDG